MNSLIIPIILSCLFCNFSANAGLFSSDKKVNPDGWAAAFNRCDSKTKFEFMKSEGHGPGGMYISPVNNALALIYDQESKELISHKHLYARQSNSAMTGVISLVRLISPFDQIDKDKGDAKHKGFSFDPEMSIFVDPQYQDVREYLISIQAHNKILNLKRTDQECDMAGFQYALGQSRSEVSALKQCQIVNIADVEKLPIALECDGQTFAFDPAILKDDDK